MRLINLEGGKPNWHITQIDKDVQVVLWDDGGALGATLVADAGSISTSSARARWRRFIKEMPTLDDWSVKNVFRELKKWLKKNGYSYE